MSLPEGASMLDISGKYTMNKSLSDSDASDTILEHQGVGMLKRKAIGWASATVHLKHFKDTEGVEHIEVAHQVSSSGTPKGEVRILTWTEQTIESPLFGKIITKTRRVSQAELDDEHLKSGWTADTLESGLIQADARGGGDIKWATTQVWGIEEIQGERRHTRHIKFTGSKGNVILARFVYDYVGTL
ncbi:hypothetical protein B0H11DRAFT_1281373 [Mycena galericulata]|nr:hypothetical protein B0H11DRAFT_1281373 [Mycena galericulata]